MKKNAIVAGAIALLVVALIAIILILFGGDPGLPEFADSREGGGERESVPQPALELDLESAGKSASATVQPEANREDPLDRSSAPPLLVGRVLGEGNGIPGATVLLFHMGEVEALLSRLEKLAPEGGGIPDVPHIVAVLREELERFRQRSVKARTDGEGYFEVRDEKEGGYFLLTLADGWLFSYGEVASLTKGRTGELTIELERGTFVGGRVVDPGGSGLGGVHVVAEYRPPGMPGVGKIVRRILRFVNGEFLKGPFESSTAADGTFTIDSLPAGLYDVTAYDEKGLESTASNVQTGTTGAVIYFGDGATIDGSFVDSQDWPVPSVEVSLERTDDMISLPLPAAGFNDVANLVNRYLGTGPKIARSADSGSFRFANLGAGKYRLTVDEPGFYSLARLVEVEWGEKKSLGIVRLSRGRRITGIVRSTAGVAIEGARVMANKADSNMFTMGKVIKDFMTARSVALTRENGAFEISGLGKGKYNLTATMDGFGADMKRGIGAGAEPIEFVLKPGITISGRVLAADGETPIADARVSARNRNERTDSDGFFVLEGVPETDPGRINPFSARRSRQRRPEEGIGGDTESSAERGENRSRGFSLRVGKKGYFEERIRLDLDDLPDDLEVRMTASPRIEGVVYDPAGEPAPGSLVRLSPSVPEEMADLGFFDMSMIFLAVSVTDMEGHFSLSDFFTPDDGRFRVIADHVLYARSNSESFTFSEKSDDTSPLEIHLQEGATLRGVVGDGRRPLAGVAVRLAKPRRRNPGEAMFMSMLGLPESGQVVRSNSAGEYVSRQVIAGEYVLSAAMVGYTQPEEVNITLEAGDENHVDFTLDPGGLFAGEVRDDLGEPVADAAVRILRSDGEDEGTLRAQRFYGGAYKRTSTTPDGLFEVLGLPRGRYSIVVEKDGYSKAGIDDVSPGARLATFVLVPASKLVGKVTEAVTGQPVTQFRVSIRSAGSDEPRWRRRTRETIDSEGMFRRNNLEPGTYKVSVSATGFLPTSSEVALEPGQVTERYFALVRSGTIRGSVVDALTQRPVAGAEIALAKNPRPPPMPSTPERKARIDRIGENEDSATTGEQGSRRSSDPREEDSAAVRSFFQESALGEKVVADEWGYFELESVPEGHQTVVVTHPDYVQTFLDGVEVPLGETWELNFRLHPGLSVEGAVVDDGGQPVPGRLLFLRGAGSSNDRVRKTQTSDSSGRFRISGLEAGSYRLLSPSRRQSGAEPLDIELTENLGDVRIVVQSP